MTPDTHAALTRLKELAQELLAETDEVDSVGDTSEGWLSTERRKVLNEGQMELTLLLMEVRV